MDALGFAVLHPPTAAKLWSVFASLQLAVPTDHDTDDDHDGGTPNAASGEPQLTVPTVPWPVARWFFEDILPGDSAGGFSTALPNPTRPSHVGVTNPDRVGRTLQVCGCPECGVGYAVLACAAMVRLSHTHDRRRAPHRITDPRHPLRHSAAPHKAGDDASASPDSFVAPVRAANRHLLAFVELELGKAHALALEQVSAVWRGYRKVMPPTAGEPGDTAAPLLPFKSACAVAAHLAATAKLTATRTPRGAARGGASASPRWGNASSRRASPRQPSGITEDALCHHIVALSRSFLVVPAAAAGCVTPRALNGSVGAWERRTSPQQRRCDSSHGGGGGGTSLFMVRRRCPPSPISDEADDVGVSLSGRGGGRTGDDTPPLSNNTSFGLGGTVGSSASSAAGSGAQGQRYGGVGSPAFAQWLKSRVEVLLRMVVPDDEAIEEPTSARRHGASTVPPTPDDSPVTSAQASSRRGDPAAADVAADRAAVLAPSPALGRPDAGAVSLPVNTVPCTGKGSKKKRRTKSLQPHAGPKPVNAQQTRRLSNPSSRAAAAVTSAVDALHLDRSAFAGRGPPSISSSALAAVTEADAPQRILPAVKVKNRQHARGHPGGDGGAPPPRSTSALGGTDHSTAHPMMPSQRASTPVRGGWSKSLAGAPEGVRQQRSPPPDSPPSESVLGGNPLAESAARMRDLLAARRALREGAQQSQVADRAAVDDHDGSNAAMALVTCPPSGPIGVGGGSAYGSRSGSRGGPLPCGFRAGPGRLRSTRPFT
jgi:hypothetical protein